MHPLIRVYQLLCQTLSRQADRPNVKIIHFQHNPQSQEFEKELNEMPQKVIGQKLEHLEAQRAEVAPEWWLEWLSLNRPETEVKSGDESVGTTTPPKDKVD